MLSTNKCVKLQSYVHDKYQTMNYICSDSNIEVFSMLTSGDDLVVADKIKMTFV